ncbi:nucleotide exchange factor GrpE [Treponema sp.]|uniref:nucleotide exchange factor GrpE n=1 Tax=Treponema sp. TaxID=166 RepID=UPI00298DCC71|nr:nucleotide exchange factor GrpE [Treponema sp.]
MADEEVKQETESTEAPETQTEAKSEENANASEQAAGQEDSSEKTEAPAEEPKEPTLEEKIEQLEKENADLKDQLLRRAADFDNYRKRMIKEKQDTFDYANANLLADLLESLDNFDRTLEASATATDVKAIVDGIKMVNGSLVAMLENKYGLTSYAVEGDEFDPDVHEAIGRVEEEGKEKETLKQVYLKGYKLKDKVIRNAKVMVSVPKA